MTHESAIAVARKVAVWAMKIPGREATLTLKRDSVAIRLFAANGDQHKLDFMFQDHSDEAAEQLVDDFLSIIDEKERLEVRSR